MNTQDKTLVAFGTVCLTASVVLSIREYRRAAAEIRKIEEDAEKDIVAIRKASAVIQARIRNHDDISSYPIGQMLTDLRNEVKFQQIAIRNED